MDWPIASVILGTIGTVAVSVIKMRPSSKGSGDSLAVLQAKVNRLERDVSELETKLAACKDLITELLLKKY